MTSSPSVYLAPSRHPVFIVLKTTRGEDNSAEVLGAFTLREGARCAILAWVAKTFTGMTPNEVYLQYDADILDGELVTEEETLTIVETPLMQVAMGPTVQATTTQSLSQ